MQRRVSLAPCRHGSPAFFPKQSERNWVRRIRAGTTGLPKRASPSAMFAAIISAHPIFGSARLILMPRRCASKGEEPTWAIIPDSVVDGGKRRIILAVLVTPGEVMDNHPMQDLLWHTCFRWHLR